MLFFASLFLALVFGQSCERNGGICVRNSCMAGRTFSKSLVCGSRMFRCCVSTRNPIVPPVLRPRLDAVDVVPAILSEGSNDNGDKDNDNVAGQEVVVPPGYPPTPEGLKSASCIPNEWESEILRLHNEFRATVKPTPNPPLRPLIWNCKIAERARASVQRCTTQHSSEGDRRTATFYLGENMGGNVWNKDDSLAEVKRQAKLIFNDWLTEAAGFNVCNNTCNGDLPNVDTSCGHFTQVIWGNSREMGCAWQSCPVPRPDYPGYYRIVCQYLAGQVNQHVTKAYEPVQSECLARSSSPYNPMQLPNWEKCELRKNSKGLFTVVPAVPCGGYLCCGRGGGYFADTCNPDGTCRPWPCPKTDVAERDCNGCMWTGTELKCPGQ